MNSFLFAFNAIFPIVLMIALGFFLRKKDLVNQNFVDISNRLVFNIFLPITLFFQVYNIESISDVPWDITIFSIVSVFVLFAIGFVIVKIFVKDNKQKGVIWQTAFRSNFALVGLALAKGLVGDEAVALVSVLLAFTISLYNMLAVVSLCVFIDEGRCTDYLAILKGIAKNPLISAIFLAFICLAIRSGMKSFSIEFFSIKENLPFVYSALSDMSKLTMPFALVVMGAQLSFKGMKKLKNMVILGTLLRVLVAPCVGLICMYLASSLFRVITFDNVDYAAMVSMFASPVAVTTAVMAKEMGSDSQLASQLVVWTSVGSIFSVFLLVTILKGANLL